MSTPQRVELVLFELGDDPAVTGPRLLGRLADPALIELVRDRLAATQRRALARLESPVRLAPDPSKPGAA